MTDGEQIQQVLKQLADEVSRLSMALTVQRSAYALLVRHLAAQDLVRPATLLADFETMGKVQPDEGWQSGHQELSVALRMVAAAPSAQVTRRKPRV